MRREPDRAHLAQTYSGWPAAPLRTLCSEPVPHDASSSRTRRDFAGGRTSSSNPSPPARSLPLSLSFPTRHHSSLACLSPAASRSDGSNVGCRPASTSPRALASPRPPPRLLPIAAAPTLASPVARRQHTEYWPPPLRALHSLRRAHPPLPAHRPQRRLALSRRATRRPSPNRGRLVPLPRPDARASRAGRAPDGDYCAACQGPRRGDGRRGRARQDAGGVEDRGEPRKGDGRCVGDSFLSLVRSTGLTKRARRYGAPREEHDDGRVRRGQEGGATARGAQGAYSFRGCLVRVSAG